MNDTLKRCLVTGLFFLSAAAYAQTPVCEWTMAGGNGTIPNGGSTGSAGNLSLTSGARLSDDVLPQNTGGNALQILGGYPTASAESAAAFDPLAGAGAFTIMGWVRRESASAGVNQSARLWSDIDTRSSRADGVEFRLSGAAGLLSLRINGQEVQSSTAGVAPDNGAWHHVAVVYDGSRAATNYNSRHVHFYIDGIQMGYGNVLSGLVVSGNTVPVTIGNSSADRSADNALVGSIDDVFVFRGWAPPPSGNGNPNPEIQSWLLLDDSTRIPGGESSDRVVPPVLLGEVQVQKIGNERLYENLKEGVIFLDGASGELYVATQDAPHGRAVCSCREWPDWHNFTNTLHINGNRIELNRFFSMQAEGNSLSIRTGTNSVFQIVGSDIGDYAPVYATPESQESYLLTANVQAEQAVLQVCTNLLEANGWRTDTVSEIIETTDASVTWRVPISAGTEPEFRRVLSATQMPAGIYARQPIVAEQGIEMGGTTWTTLPDTNAYLTAETDAAALAALAAETSARTAADSALDGAVASVEERLDEVETLLDEYWCTWAATKLADGVENWIPTNWPARKVWCCLYINRWGDFTISMPNWTPPEPCELHLLVRKQGGTNSVFTVKAPGGTALSSSSSSTASSRVCEFYYHPATGWITGATAWSQSLFPTETLPDDTTFLPTTNNPVSPVLSMAPSILPSLSPFVPNTGNPVAEEPLDELDIDDPQDPETDR